MNTAGNLASALAPVTQMQTVGVLAAKSAFGPGRTSRLELRHRPVRLAANASGAFIRSNERPDAAIQIIGPVAAAALVAAPMTMRGKSASVAGFAVPVPTMTQM